MQSNDDEQNEQIASVIDKTIDYAEFEQKQMEKERDKRRRQKRKRLAGYIRSRKVKRRLKGQGVEHVLNPVSVQLTDDNTIPKADMPYKKYRNEILEIISQNEILESRTRVNRRASQPFNYGVVSAQPQQAPKKKSSLGNPLKKESQTVSNVKVSGPLKEKTKSRTTVNTLEMDTSPRARARRRINYSEELVDEAFMYEQILHDKQKSQEKRKKFTKRLIPQSKNNESTTAVRSEPSPANLDSRLRLLEQRNEISIMPVKSRMMEKDSANKFDSKMPIPMKAEPLFNITSSVSVFKQRKSDQTPPAPSSSIQISNITSLHKNRAGPLNKRRKISCTYCTKIFPDKNQLATHQMTHLQVSAHRIDAVQVLNPKLRRVSFIYSFFLLKL